MTCRVILEFTLVRNRTAVCSGQSRILIQMACRDILKLTQVRNPTFVEGKIKERKVLIFEESFQVMLPSDYLQIFKKLGW
jgi:hypothetical protein